MVESLHTRWYKLTKRHIVLQEGEGNHKKISVLLSLLQSTAITSEYLVLVFRRCF